MQQTTTKGLTLFCVSFCFILDEEQVHHNERAKDPRWSIQRGAACSANWQRTIHTSFGQVLETANTAKIRKVSNLSVWGLGMLTSFATLHCFPKVLQCSEQFQFRQTRRMHLVRITSLTTTICPIHTLYDNTKLSYTSSNWLFF